MPLGRLRRGASVGYGEYVLQARIDSDTVETLLRGPLDLAMVSGTDVSCGPPSRPTTGTTRSCRTMPFGWTVSPTVEFDFGTLAGLC